MAVEVVKDEAAWTVKLAGVCDIFDVAALHEAALAVAAQAPGPVVVSFHAVEGIDTASTQVLLALRTALTSRGRDVRFDGMPAPAAERWRQIGVEGA
jgi:anti-anti-sigma regulatory factor